MAEIKPEMLEAARAAGMQGLPEPTPADDDTTDQHLDTTATTDATPDKGTKVLEPSESGGDDQLSQFPDNYFGTDIRAYAEEHGVEAATTYHNALKDANRVANRRMQEISELRKTAEADAAKEAAAKRVTDGRTAPEQVEVSDEALLEQYGIDPAVLQYEEVGAPLLAMAKRQHALEQQVASFTANAQATAWESEFHGKMDTLQKEHGQLVYEDGSAVDRADLEEYAIETETYDPEALYWRIMGPVIASQKAVATPPAPKADPKRRDLKRSISPPQRKGGAPNSIEGPKPKTFREHFAAVKESQGITGDPFAE